MAHNVKIGGDRLGSGNKMEVELHGFERSTHNLSRPWRSTMAPGTLVPFFTEIGLPGDTFDIELDADVYTQPTIGPLFATYKLQLDVFQSDIRLYNANLNMNLQGIGLKMNEITLPQITMEAYKKFDPAKGTVDNQQINPSCIFHYLGIKGLGLSNDISSDEYIARDFHGGFYLMYWDTYKQYYANKQEGIGVVVHQDLEAAAAVPSASIMTNGTGAQIDLLSPPVSPPVPEDVTMTLGEEGQIVFTLSLNISNSWRPSQIRLVFQREGRQTIYERTLDDIFETIQYRGGGNYIIATDPRTEYQGTNIWWGFYSLPAKDTPKDAEPSLVTFPLENIDNMRKLILTSVNEPVLKITKDNEPPYNLPLLLTDEIPGEGDKCVFAKQFANEGLAVKTYQADLFNNWMDTEWIDGANGINEITKIDTTDGGFTIDELNMSKKLYEVLNRIAISDGSYDAWQNAVYDHKRSIRATNPVYIGGLIKNIVFEEIVSSTATETQPLGTLAGRGRLGGKHKGGQITAKIDEPAYLMGLISITPIIDYSQGNKWDVNLKTLDDLHKPGLDQIGFQDLITDQMAWFDTKLDPEDTLPTFKSAGKQPAWINYMTNVNVVRGNFAVQSQQMFMVLNRQYGINASPTPSISDLTTYIDPVKFNNIFADTRIDAQNFWMQIGVGMQTRRKMSAKIMPNL